MKRIVLSSGSSSTWFTLVLVLVVALLASQGCSPGDSRADEPARGEQAESTPEAGSDGGSSQQDSERRRNRRGDRNEDSDETDNKPETEAVPVEVAELGLGSIESVLRFSTNLEAEREVEVYAEAARRVEELRVEEGAEVTKGDLLVRLQDDEQRTTLAKARTEYAKARREYERQKKLFEDELISEQAMNDATYQIERLELEVEEAERALSYTEVRAPISGTITERRVNVGDYVTVNQQLFQMVDFDSIVARIFVPEKELPRLKEGLTARVGSPALGEARYTGEVDRISPVVDPRSGTVKVTVDLPRSPGLRPGMYVDVELVTNLHRDALLLPKRALVYDSDQIFAFRLSEEDGETTARRVLVQPVLEDKTHIEVSPDGGFEPGDRVIIAGQAGLKDGTAVRRVDLAEQAPQPADEPERADAAEAKE